MIELLFLARHIPFWGIPLIIMGGEFGYMYWLKKKKKSAALCLMLAFIGLTSNIFYVYIGGPDQAVKAIKKAHRNYK
jgi:hypothetical protein